MREALRLSRPSSVFPWTTAGGRPDLDHTVPFVPAAAGGPPGQTRIDNLGPMSRFAHRVKTHGRGWRHRQPVPGVYLWRTPHGFWFRTDQHGSRPLGRDPVAGTRRARWRRSSRASCSRAEAVPGGCRAWSAAPSAGLRRPSLRADPLGTAPSPRATSWRRHRESPRGQPSGGAAEPKPLTRTPRSGSGRSGAGAPNWEESRASCASAAATSPFGRKAAVRYGVRLTGPFPTRSSSTSASRLVRLTQPGEPRRPARRRRPRGTPARCRRGLSGDQPAVALLCPRPVEQPDQVVPDRALGTGPPLHRPGEGSSQGVDPLVDDSDVRSQPPLVRQPAVRCQLQESHHTRCERARVEAAGVLAPTLRDEDRPGVRSWVGHARSVRGRGPVVGDPGKEQRDLSAARCYRRSGQGARSPLERRQLALHVGPRRLLPPPAGRGVWNSVGLSSRSRSTAARPAAKSASGTWACSARTPATYDA